MTWTNAFDVGVCTVTVWANGDLSGSDFPNWSGVLAKGESSPAFDGGPFNDVNMTVSVNAAGEVSLSADGADATGMSVAVIPAYDISGADLRVSGIAISPNNLTGFADNGADASVLLTPTSSPAVTPDPAVITSETSGAEMWWVSNLDTGGPGG